jgi:flagellar biosynthesis protein FlhF
MQIKRYEASGIQEAMDKIRKDLGEDAVILSTKRVKRGKIPLIEVTAARDAVRTAAAVPIPAPVRPAPVVPAAPAEANLKAEIAEIKRMLADFRRENPLRADVIELKETVHTLFDLIGIMKQEQGDFSSVYHHLIACGISRERAYKMMDRIKSDCRQGEGEDCGNALQRLEDLVKKALNVPNPKAAESRALAFIGPTGVGKTTTLAKLAARYALEGKKKIGLIATDTYRIAAAEQLKVYARIMGLPFEVAAERDGFKKAMAKFSNLDLIMIDTPGSNQSNDSQLGKVRDILGQAESLNTYLLLSLTSSRENMLDAARKFSRIPYDGVIFTKIDESVSFGSIYDIIDQIRKPVPYITTGQNVPKDIVKTTPAGIAKLIMSSQLN